MFKCYTTKKLCDEDWKTQAAQGYPDIPKNTEVQYIEEITNFYGRYAKVRWAGTVYYVKYQDLEWRQV